MIIKCVFDAGLSEWEWGPHGYYGVFTKQDQEFPGCWVALFADEADALSFVSSKEKS